MAKTYRGFSITEKAGMSTVRPPALVKIGKPGFSPALSENPPFAGASPDLLETDYKQEH